MRYKLKAAMPHDTPRHRASARLQTWAQVNGLKQKELAARFGRSQAWVSRNLLSIGPDIDYLDEIGRVTGHDPGDFVTLREVRFSRDIAQVHTAQSDNSSFGTPPYGSVTAPALVPPHTTGVLPLEEESPVPSSFPSSPSHVTLYGLIGKLTEEEADTVTEPLLALIRRVQAGTPEPPPKRK